MAKHSLPRLLGVLVLLLAAIALVVGVCFYETQSLNERQSLWFWWRHALLLTTGNGEGSIASDTSNILRQLAQIAAALTSMLVPGLMLGAVVYKLFLTPDLFQFRNKIAVVKNPVGQDYLAIRLYNTTQLEVIDVDFEVYYRAENVSANGVRVPNVRLNLEQDTWPMALPSVPYTIRCLLDQGDVDSSPETPVLRAINGRAVPSKFRILVVANGSVPALGTEFATTQWFRARDISATPPTDIRVVYDTDPADWKGWETFDE